MAMARGTAFHAFATTHCCLEPCSACVPYIHYAYLSCLLVSFGRMHDMCL
jgi:hypothetical protein